MSNSSPATNKPQTIMLKPIVDLPTDYCIALGQIASKWSWLENQLGVLIREGFGLDKKEGRVLLAGMAMKVKSPILRILALKWVGDATLRDELRKLAKDCIKQTNPRNDHIHGFWVHPVGHPDIIGLQIMESGEQRYLPDFKRVPLADLHKIVSDLKQIQIRAQLLTDKIKGRTQVSPAPSGR
jgi:hypothetical protein